MANGEGRGVARAARPKPLYAQLQPRPNGPDAARVAANQRARLCAAMVEAVAENGYEKATVARVCALAGVSKRTLYQRFANKDECFVAAYDQIVERCAARVRAAYQAGRQPGYPDGSASAPDPGDRDEALSRALEVFAREIAERPKSARLALMDVRAAGPRALARALRTELLVERALARALASDGGRIALFSEADAIARTREEDGTERTGEDDGTARAWGAGGTVLPAPLAHGIQSGVRAVAQLRLIEGEPAAIVEAVSELHEWTLAYRSPFARAAFDLAKSVAPISRAPTARARPGDSLELVSAQALATAMRVGEGAADWPDAVCRALLALLRQVARDPLLARVAFVEPHATGRVALERRAEVMRGFAALLVRRAPPACRPSQVVAEAIVGGVGGVVARHVLSGRAREVESLAPWAACLVLAPTLRAADARRAAGAIGGSPAEVGLVRAA